MTPFYGADQAAIHDAAFGDLARVAADRLLAELSAAGHRRGTVVDLGCGSGILAAAVSGAGYDVVGVDLSAAMVELAQAAAPAATFVQGSLHDFDLPGGVVGITAIGEALNYATDAQAGLEALERLAQRAVAALVPGGLFLFDVATPGRNLGLDVRHVFHDRDSWCLFVEATEDREAATLERAITIFREADPGRYRRSHERHVQRLYEPEAVVDVVERAGFEVELFPGYGPEPTSSTPPQGWTVVLARRR